MLGALPPTKKAMLSHITFSGELQLSITNVPIEPLGDDEVLVKIEAAPIHNTDVQLMFGGADLNTVQVKRDGENLMLTARVPDTVLANARASISGRIGLTLTLGYEAAGTVVATGNAAAAKALLGKSVAFLERRHGAFSEYHALPASECHEAPAGTTAVEACSAFINPLSALCMVHTMKTEGHKALINTAAAGPLGRMLTRLCAADGIGLVSVVREQAHVELLRKEGATHVCNMRSPTFEQDLTEAIAATGATLAFDAVGGGPLAGQILASMEKALLSSSKTYKQYGSYTFKQIYVFGYLEPPPTLIAGPGPHWRAGGWLLFDVVDSLGPEGFQQVKRRIYNEYKTIFYTDWKYTISMEQAFDIDIIRQYSRRATGENFIMIPSS